MAEFWRRLRARFAALLRTWWWGPLVGTVIGAAIALTRLALQPVLGVEQPFLLSWPAILIAAFLGGFWPAVAVAALGFAVGQFALKQAGGEMLEVGGILVFAAFGLAFAAAGGMRKQGLRRARADAERLGEMQQQLIRVARLNAMGEMAGTLAHELNQPLTAITSYNGAARRLVERGAEPERIVELLQKASDQALRARDVIARVRAHVAGGELSPAPQSLSRMFDEAIVLSRVARGPQDMDVRCHLEPAADKVLADQVQIQQVMLNLLRNAAEAMADSPRRELDVVGRCLEDGMVQVSVSDTGPGIAPQVLERLFQPFVSGKHDGMGVGLSISRNIVEAHGGRMWADRSANGGAAFHFTLRSAREPPVVESGGS